MFAWLAENAGTIIVALILLIVMSAAIIKMIRDRKNGKSSCGCGCAHCAMSGSCHKTK